MDIASLVSKLDSGELAGWSVILIFCFLTLVQISPLKLNPWDSILSWVGKKLNGKTMADLSALKEQVNAMWVNDHRRAILTFARELRAGMTHSSDEWSTVLTLIDEYEVYCEKHHVANGVVKADSHFICDLYQALSREQKI